MNYSIIKKIDSQDLHQVYENWPHQAEKAFNQNLEPLIFSDINHIILAGMGGSGAVSDLIKSIFSKTSIHVDVVKGYHLPKTVHSDSLVITISVSGNTQETLSILQESNRIGSKSISFSSGGKIENFCKQNKLEHRFVEKIHSPRASLPSFLYSILNVLSTIIQIDKKDIKESIENLKKTQLQISSKNLSDTNPSLKLANWISGIPMIYHPYGLESVAIRFKNSLQENAKLHSAIEDVIEACHNNFVAWEKKSIMNPILIKGQDDHLKTKERWKIIEEFFREKEIEYYGIESIEGSILNKLINLIYTLDYASIYLAIKNGIDPTPIKSIDYIKNKLD